MRDGADASGHRSARALSALALAAATLLAVGCALLGVKEQREALEDFARIRGEVRGEEPYDGPIVVVLGQGSSAADIHIVDHYVLARPGRFAFFVSPGTFWLAAFEDRNANLVYDPGEPVLPRQPDFELATGETLDDVELEISRHSVLDARYDIAELQARSPRDQGSFTLGRFTVMGKLARLDDPKFGAASGRMGMWRFVDFLFEVGPGVYFLDEFDPHKIPVLFVHGISGYPQEFSTLIEHLDREHFQPWFYFYPSGIDLDGIADHLSSIVVALRERHGFDEMAVVAHSMGGLVSRAFIQRYFDHTRRRDRWVFVAISTPWGGSESAAGVEQAPEDVVVYSWLDMNPQSDFLRGLFYAAPDFARKHPLPPNVEFHMLFGYRRDELSFGPSGDGVVSVKSEARLEAVEEARSILPLDSGHADILHSPEAVKRLNGILADAFGYARSPGGE